MQGRLSYAQGKALYKCNCVHVAISKAPVHKLDSKRRKTGRKKGLGSARHYIGGGYVFEVEEKGGGQKQTRGRGAADDGHRGEGESVGGGEASFFACCERLCK